MARTVGQIVTHIMDSYPRVQFCPETMTYFVCTVRNEIFDEILHLCKQARYNGADPWELGEDIIRLRERTK